MPKKPKPPLASEALIKRARSAWYAMRKRCLNPRSPAWGRYGGAGITICPQWATFDQFLKDMGQPPTADHWLGRKDVKGHYTPSNCVWTLPEQQQRRRAFCHGRELIKANQTMAATVTGDELPPYKVPLVGRLYGNTRGPSGQSEAYYENIRAINLVESEIQGRRRQREEVQSLMSEEPLADLVGLGRGTETMIRRLRQRRRVVAERREEGFEAEVARLDGEIGEAMAKLNNAVTKARRAAEDRE